MDFVCLIDQIMCNLSGMLQFHLQFDEELTVVWVKTVKYISGAFFGADRSACSSKLLLPLWAIKLVC